MLGWWNLGELKLLNAIKKCKDFMIASLMWGGTHQMFWITSQKMLPTAISTYPMNECLHASSSLLHHHEVFSPASSFFSFKVVPFFVRMYPCHHEWISSTFPFWSSNWKLQPADISLPSLTPQDGYFWDESKWCVESFDLCLRCERPLKDLLKG